MNFQSWSAHPGLNQKWYTTERIWVICKTRFQSPSTYAVTKKKKVGDECKKLSQPVHVINGPVLLCQRCNLDRYGLCSFCLDCYLTCWRTKWKIPAKRCNCRFTMSGREQIWKRLKGVPNERIIHCTNCEMNITDSSLWSILMYFLRWSWARNRAPWSDRCMSELSCHGWRRNQAGRYWWFLKWLSPLWRSGHYSSQGHMRISSKWRSSQHVWMDHCQALQTRRRPYNLSEHWTYHKRCSAHHRSRQMRHLLLNNSLVKDHNYKAEANSKRRKRQDET